MMRSQIRPKQQRRKTIMKKQNIVKFALGLAAGFVWLGLLAKVQAVSPAPDGGYANFNTAEGDNALLSLTTGANNTANGSSALANNTTGAENTANGSTALGGNTTGPYNTANGFNALYRNTTGSRNTATGVNALFSNATINGVSGSYNTANG